VIQVTATAAIQASRVGTFEAAQTTALGAQTTRVGTAARVGGSVDAVGKSIRGF